MPASPGPLLLWVYLTSLPGWMYLHSLELPTWVDAEGALDEAAPHAGGSADDGVHV